jgi:hypothetical protein
MTTKRSHKLKALGNVEGVIAGAATLREAARRLNVDRSTIHRWLRAGKISRHARPALPIVAVPTETPDAWAQRVRDNYDLSGTEEQLLRLAVRALILAQGTKAAPAVQLAAAGRFQALVRQLNLEAPTDGAIEADASRIWPRRVGVG